MRKKVEFYKIDYDFFPLEQAYDESEKKAATLSVSEDTERNIG